jgi:anti-sigma B factor antagonist
MGEISLPASTGVLTVQEEIRGDDCLCRIVDARIEARNAFALKKYLQERMKAASGRTVLDLSTVSFIDSSGLGALLGGLKAAPRKEALVLVRPVAAVVSIFRVTRTEALFAWADSVEAAFAPAG